MLSDCTTIGTFPKKVNMYRIIRSFPESWIFFHKKRHREFKK